MKHALIILLVFASSEAAAQNYWLDKSLNKVVVMEGDKATTYPSGSNGTRYVHKDKKQEQLKPKKKGKK